MSKFSAADSALGYFYQVQVALLYSLKKIGYQPDFLVSLETLDDVAFESLNSGSPDELLQTKHHISRQANLTDASPDLWKSLRVWFEGRANQSIQPNAGLYLLTTGQASEGSAPFFLRFENRDIQRALTALEATACTSSSKENRVAYDLFLAAPLSDRFSILERVFVVDSSPIISDMDTELKREIRWAVERAHQDVFVERLQGWWFKRVLSQLAETQPKILGEELETQMSELREQFKQDALPIDDDLLEYTLDEATKTSHAESQFVIQLNFLDVGRRRVANAIRDYYKAFEQRSRWLRDELVFINELKKYERRLCDEWEVIFAAMEDEVGSDATEEVKKTAARAVLKWAESAHLPIRPQVTEGFICRGSLHMLADESKVGWHPDFRAMLASLFEDEAGVS